MQKKTLNAVNVSRVEATRRCIQHEFLRLLREADFRFRRGEKEPRGIQARVVRTVNQQKYGRQFLKTNHAQVSDWVGRMRQNGYKFTAVKIDYSRSRYNRKRFFDAEQRRIRDLVREEKLKSTQVATVYSDKERKQIPVSASSTRRFLKRKFPDEPSMVAARPKGMKVGGNTAHHNKCRLIEAKYWRSKGQDFIDRMFFADESKITFREHKNKQIDIEWVFRGEACDSNWYEEPRWPGQINLFILQSKRGIEYYDIYHRNMKIGDYRDMLPHIGEVIRSSDTNFSAYMHDNAWKGTQPVGTLNRHIGRNKWTQYMGRPCNKDHPTRKTPIRKLPVKVPKLRCPCSFPSGHIHAAFNPKLNIAENTFAEIDRILTDNKIKDAIAGRPWILKGAGKKKFWVRQMKKAIRQINKNKAFFENQHNTYLERCTLFIQSRGKRLRTSKY